MNYCNSLLRSKIYTEQNRIREIRKIYNQIELQV